MDRVFRLGWSDVSQLDKVKSKAIIGALSNGSLRIMLDIAKHAGLPWDMCVLVLIKLYTHPPFSDRQDVLQDLLLRDDWRLQAQPQSVPATYGVAQAEA